VEKVRLVAAALGVPWPDGATFGQVVHGLDPSIPGHAAFLHESAILLRGAAYAAFDGTLPALTTHAAVAAPYSHVTAPLRRLPDRYATEVCLAVAAGRPVPPEIAAGLPALPQLMAQAGQRSAGVDRACVDLVEAIILQDQVGADFDAITIDDHPVTVQVTEPAVIAHCEGENLPLGERIRVRLVKADPATRQVVFAPNLSRPLTSAGPDLS
jgi:exoribonuclease R